MKIAVPIVAILMVNAIKMKVEGALGDGAVPSNLICFSKNIEEGKYISAMTNVRNLALYSEEGANYTYRMHSCSVTGIVIMYEFPDFEGNFNAFDGDGSSFIPSVLGNVSSIRMIERNHKYSSEVVLFQKPLFQTTKSCTFLRETIVPVHCRTPGSVVVKGFADWTLISEIPNPNGPGVITTYACLKSNSFGASFIPTLNKNNIGYVVSIKQGCEGKIIGGEDHIIHKDCRCNSEGVENGDVRCNENGDCKCKEQFKGRKCDMCDNGFFMKDMICKGCRCNPSQSDNRCDKNGHCNCTDPTFSGKRCNIKTIHITNLQPNIQKNLLVKCHEYCGRVSLNYEVKNNTGGNLKIESGYGRFRCDGDILKDKYCTGKVRARSFYIKLNKYTSPANINIKIFASSLDEVNMIQP